MTTRSSTPQAEPHKHRKVNICLAVAWRWAVAPIQRNFGRCRTLQSCRGGEQAVTEIHSHRCSACCAISAKMLWDCSSEEGRCKNDQARGRWPSGSNNGNATSRAQVASKRRRGDRREDELPTSRQQSGHCSGGDKPGCFSHGHGGHDPLRAPSRMRAWVAARAGTGLPLEAAALAQATIRRGRPSLTPKVVWLFVFVVLYWGYCIFWGIRGARLARTARDYFIAGRKLSLWVFVLAATATSYSGWTFMGHPGLDLPRRLSVRLRVVLRDRHPVHRRDLPEAAVDARQALRLCHARRDAGRLLSRATPSGSLTVVVALFYSIPYLGVQLGASGYLFNVLTATPAYPNGLVGEDFGMWVLSLVVLIYVASGGLRAVAYVDTVQCVLLWLGIVIVGIIALEAVGGWNALNMAMSRSAHSDVGRWGTTQGVACSGGDYNAYFAVPGVIQWTAGLGKETPIGGIWTGVMILTYMFALMGIQAAPAFTMWAFSNTNPAPFAPQAVWASAAWIGGTLIFFTDVSGHGSPFPRRQSAGHAGRTGGRSHVDSGGGGAKSGRARALLLQPDRREHAVAGRAAGGMRARGDAVDRGGIHVDRPAAFSRATFTSATSTPARRTSPKSCSAGSASPSSSSARSSLPPTRATRWSCSAVSRSPSASRCGCRSPPSATSRGSPAPAPPGASAAGLITVAITDIDRPDCSSARCCRGDAGR